MSLFIGNQWNTGSGPIFSSQNPATGKTIWEGHSCTQKEVEEAVFHAQGAFESWSEMPLDQRKQFLIKFSEILHDSQKDFAEVISKEIGKPLWDSKNEITSMINKGVISFEAYAQRCPEVVRPQSHTQLITRHRPHGVVAVLGPFNFPASLPHGHILPALLAGNTIVFKPSELSPWVAEETMRLWEKAGLPPGVINMVQGGRETGKYLIEHRDIDGIFFTGSYPTGLILSQLCSKQFSKILALELGGNNPLVLGEISNIAAAVYLIIQSAYLTSGQRCTCARRLIIPNTSHGDKLLDELLKKVQLLTLGPYDSIPEPFMGPIISEAHVQFLLQSQEELISQGGNALLEMRALKPGTGWITPGLMDVTQIKNRKDQEFFGPFLQVIRVNDFREAIDEANQTQFGLVAGLISENKKEYDLFYRKIRAGVINWNAPTTGASSAAPFGGIKCSGNHRPSAFYAADYCAYPVASQETHQLLMPSSLLPGMENFL